MTKRPRVPEPPHASPARLSNTVASGAPFNILAPHLPLPEALVTAGARSYKDPPLTGSLQNYAPGFARRRAVDLITNKYVHDDEARKARDAAAERATALERYWRRANLNPLTQTYVDEGKEAAYQVAVEVGRRVQGLADVARKPPAVACRLGEVYDIVRHMPRAAAHGGARVLAMVDAMDARPLRRLTRRAEHEAAAAAAGAAAAAASERRSLSRASARRIEEGTTTHGFNVVTGAVADAHALDGAFAVAARPATGAWARIAGDLSPGGGGGGGAGGGRPRAGTAPAAAGGGAWARHTGGWLAEEAA